MIHILRKRTQKGNRKDDKAKREMERQTLRERERERSKTKNETNRIVPNNIDDIGCYIIIQCRKSVRAANWKPVSHSNRSLELNVFPFHLSFGAFGALISFHGFMVRVSWQ